MASSKRKDPASTAASRIFVLEEEVRSLTEELNQCQVGTDEGEGWRPSPRGGPETWLLTALGDNEEERGDFQL